MVNSAGELLRIPAITLVVDEPVSRPLRYAVEQLTDFCRRSPEIQVCQRQQSEPDKGIPVFVGRGPATRIAPSSCADVDWAALGEEGFILRCVRHDSAAAVIAAGSTDAGTRHAVYALMCSLDVASSPPTLPADLNLREKPSFALRGMYAHQHWAYAYPYALRTWSVDEWKSYVDLLALMRVNLFQIWSMAAICPVPLSEGDEAFLRRYPAIIEHARGDHGMEVWIGECANNMSDTHDAAPVAERDYFKVESLKNPADRRQMAELREARKEFYRICDNADGYWVLDSDPGKWEGSPAGQFVDILMMNRELINEYTQLGERAKLVYWMWMGWGTGRLDENWRDTVAGLLERAPEPWWLTASWEGHWRIVDELGVADRTVYYPYGTVETEPSLPFTIVVPHVLSEVLEVPERIGAIRGVMGNAQTPLCQLPNIYYFARAIWNMELRAEERERAVEELARLIYPQQAALLSKCWLCLADPRAAGAAVLADELQALCESNGLGRPGPVGIKLFPDYGQVARDLAMQLRIHGLAADFCAMVEAGTAGQSQMLDQLKRYCLASLAWRRTTGYRTAAASGCTLFAVREAVRELWCWGTRLAPEAYAELQQAMRAEFEPWEADLLLTELNA